MSRSTKPLGTRLTNESLEQLDRIAAERKIPKTRLMRLVVEEFLSAQKESPNAA
ncbi:MAG: hypothetical protein LH702_18615 [Phormidesmis sp. CAN_BIN44]|nr:hypothetical protein [Phormidesmis sp. CAN_BIN44]